MGRGRESWRIGGKEEGNEGEEEEEEKDEGVRDSQSQTMTHLQVLLPQ